MSNRAQARAMAMVAIVDPPAANDDATPVVDAAVPLAEANAATASESSEAVNASALPQAKPPLQRLLARITRDRIITALLACISIGAFFLVWYFGTKYRIEFYIRFKNVPTPYEVLKQAIEVGGSNKYLINIGVSVRRILLGFVIAIAVGVPLGLLIGKYRRVRDLFMPVVEIMRPIPAIAWVPMSIMLWPNNESSIVFITFIGAFFPILLNTIHGVHSPRRRLDPGRRAASARVKSGCSGM